MKYKRILFVLALLLLSACGAVKEIFDPAEAPVINYLILSSESVFPFDTVMAIVDAENPESGLLQYSWTNTGGRFIEPSDKDTIRWIAPTIGGVYTLSVNVSNSEETTAADKDVHVRSQEEPVVDIQKPRNNDYFILYEEINITCAAAHDEGLDWVRLVIISPQGDSTAFEPISYNTGGKYNFTFENESPELVGTSTIMIEAKASNNKRGRDFVKIKIEGILPGGNIQ